MYVKTSDLRHLDVISITDGRHLGHICDVDMDPETGKLQTLIVEQPGHRWLWFLRAADTEIAWQDVTLIGVDVVLVTFAAEDSRKPL